MSHADSAPAGLVLVVDDEEAVREVARLGLEDAGYEVLVAAGGAEALERFRARQGEIDAVLLDVTMPDLGGDEVLAALRALVPGIPVILCSGHAESELEEEIGRPEGVRFLKKPYRVAELRQAVAAALGGGSASTSS